MVFSPVSTPCGGLVIIMTFKYNRNCVAMEIRCPVKHVLLAAPQKQDTLRQYFNLSPE